MATVIRPLTPTRSVRDRDETINDLWPQFPASVRESLLDMLSRILIKQLSQSLAAKEHKHESSKDK
jgi:hypothetical protein